MGKGERLSPVTHFLTGWVLANSAPELDRRERMLVTLACVAPDVDGLGIVAEFATRNSSHPLLWFSEFHHQLHSLLFAMVIAVVCFALSRHRWMTAGLAFASVHLHLLEDLAGSRGPDGYSWPIPYLAPFYGGAGWSWTGQWALNAWPNFAITVLLLGVTFYLAAVKGFSPLEMISRKADAEFVKALQKWFSKTSFRNG